MNGDQKKMKKLTKIYNRFDIVVVPFPFIDSSTSKRRPAIVLSAANQFNGKANASIMAMITSARHTPWPLDVIIDDLSSSGLPVKSIIRMKIFTLDHGLILDKIGLLGKIDQKNLNKNLKLVFI